MDENEENLTLCDKTERVGERSNLTSETKLQRLLKTLLLNFSFIAMVGNVFDHYTYFITIIFLDGNIRLKNYLMLPSCKIYRVCVEI